MQSGMIKKLQNQAGESLAEVLVAILVIAVATTMLAMMITATLNMVKTSEKKMNEYYTDSQKLEKLDENTKNGTITIKGNDELEKVSVVYYENKAFTNSPVVAYKLTPPSPAPTGDGT